MTNKTQDVGQPAQDIPSCWVTFTDDTQQKVASVHSGPIPQNPQETRLPVTDPRVLALIDPPESHRVIKWRIHDLDQLNKLAYLFDTGTPKPVYRGQSNYTWRLETRLERLAPEFVKKESGLEIFEYQTLTEAKRRLHHHLSTLPEDEDLLSWLALLRHHGVPTRLLDVTKSLFVACYFAVRDAIPQQDAALWIFPRIPFDRAYSEWCYRHREAVIRNSPFTVAQYGEYYWPLPKSVSRPTRTINYDSLREWPGSPWLKFPSVLEAAMLGYIAMPGAGIAEPYWLPKRMDAQQGAFLIPFNVRHSFEENLFSYLSIDPTQDLISDAEEIEMPDNFEELQQAWFKTPAFKIRLSANLHELMRVRLNAMNVRELTLFPDLEGAMQHISSYVPIERK